MISFTFFIEPELSLVTFRKTWRQLCPHVVVAKPRTDLCDTCQTNTNQILRASNTDDANKMQTIAEAHQHLARAAEQREHYQTCISATKQHLQPTHKLIPMPVPTPPPPRAHYCFDFAQQVHYPSDPFQVGPIYFLTPRKCQLFGICCAAIPQQVTFIFIFK